MQPSPHEAATVEEIAHWSLLVAEVEGKELLFLSRQLDLRLK